MPRVYLGVGSNIERERYITAGLIAVPLVIWWGWRDLCGIGWTRGIILAAIGGLPYLGLMIGGLWWAPATNAAIINLAATIDCAQANAGAGTGSAGTGTATMTLDTVTNLFSWNVSWSGLTGTAVAAHFHGASLPGVMK